VIVSIHQPHFLPWLGYLDRMRRCDVFVLLDHVQFERQNYQNRVKIKTGHGPLWLTVPVLQRSRSEAIVDKRIDNQARGRHHWSHRIYAAVEHAYRGAPHFDARGSQLRTILSQPWDRLAELDRALLDWLREELHVRTPLVRSSELAVSGSKGELVLDICRLLGASVFLGGNGASRRDLDVERFRRLGIRVEWQEFRHPRYPQHPRRETFVEGLSALDLLFNCGSESANILARAGASESVESAAGAAVLCGGSR
jgi:hypothetical protein